MDATGCIPLREARIMDVFGKEVLSKENKNFNEVILNVSELAQGIYFAKVTTDGKVSTKKFVKE